MHDFIVSEECVYERLEAMKRIAPMVVPPSIPYSKASLAQGTEGNALRSLIGSIDCISVFSVCIRQTVIRERVNLDCGYIRRR